jgi:hypothetical protein
MNSRQTTTSLALALFMTLLAGGLGLASGCVEQAEDQPTPEDLEYVKQHLLKEAPTPKLTVNANLDGKLVYLGMDADPVPVEPGKDTKLVHYWKVIEAPGEGWRMFTHLNGPNNQGFINVDHGPIRGKYPVSNWKAGDIIRDEHFIRLPATWPHDKVEVYTGIWKGSLRMPVKSGPQDGMNRVMTASLPVTGQKTLIERKYVVRKVAKAPKIDGKLDEAAWKDAPSAGTFVGTMDGASVRQRTDVKMLWDDKNLYFAFDNQDDDVWGLLTNRDDKLWQQEAVEIMIDANGDGKGYVEFQVSPQATLFDTYLPEYRKYEDVVDPKAKPFSWNSGIKAAVKVDGTLNKREDADKGWTVEIAIPHADVNGMVKEGGVKVPPEIGSIWKLNMYRIDQTKAGAQEASAWSPPMVPDFHKLDRFGSIVFADEKGEMPAPEVAAAPAGEPPSEGEVKVADEAASKKALKAKRMEAVKEALGGMVKGTEKAENALKVERQKVKAQ